MNGVMPRRFRAWRLFFPTLALYSSAMAPLSLQAMMAVNPWLPALASPLAHGREMLSGFGLGVVAGFLLGVLSAYKLCSIFALWITARIAWLLDPGGIAAIAAQTLFTLTFAVIVVPRFLGRGRKVRNLMTAPLILLLAFVAILLDLLPNTQWSAASHLLTSAVLLFAWLMAFMGGRMIAPAAAGARYRQGENMTARVQPVLEGFIIFTLLLAVLCALLLPVLQPSGVLSMVAGLLIAVRLARWQLWRCRRRIDLWCLGVGYAWLAVGLLLLGLALLRGQPVNTVLHALTIGAMGTLIFNVMLRTHLQYDRQSLETVLLFPVGTALIALAAICRLAVPFGPTGNLPLLWLAAAAWSIAYFLLAMRVLADFYRQHSNNFV